MNHTWSSEQGRQKHAQKNEQYYNRDALFLHAMTFLVNDMLNLPRDGGQERSDR